MTTDSLQQPGSGGPSQQTNKSTKDMSMDSKLLALPSEIRILIYEYIKNTIVFKKNPPDTGSLSLYPSSQQPQLDLQEIQIHGAPTNLLATCSFIRNEYMRYSAFPPQATLVFQCKGFYVSQFQPLHFQRSPWFHRLEGYLGHFSSMTQTHIDMLRHVKAVTLEIFVEQCHDQGEFPPLAQHSFLFPY